MELLQERIRREGRVLPGNIVKVDGFLNHRVDTRLLEDIADEFAKYFDTSKITVVLTAEASGIALATICAQKYGVPMLFAKKAKSDNIESGLYQSEVFSYTYKKRVTLLVSQEWLNADDHVLIIDDFMANGFAVQGLVDIVNEAGAKLEGIGIAVEKGFQGGGDRFRASGILVLHRDHDGGGNAVEIAVSHKAAHDGIYCHIELRALEICAVAHIRKDGLRVLVERRTDEHLFASIHLQLNARVHVQRHHGGYRVHLLVEQSAAEQHHRKAGGNERCPSSLRRFLCCHGNYRSFPLFAARENAVHIVWRGLFKRRSQSLLHFFIGHRASSPSRKIRIFFNAL